MNSRIRNAPHLSKVNIVITMDSIVSLAGGTENQVVKLINNLDKNKYELHLILLRDTDWIRENGKHLNCSIHTFNIVRLRKPRNILSFMNIVRSVRTIKPDIVMTFFPLSNIMGVIAARLAQAPIIISTRRDYGLWLNWEHRLSIHALRFADRYVDKIVVNASVIRELTSREERFDAAKIDVIYNGVDIDNPLPDERQTSALRAKLAIPGEAPVIGIVGGLKPMKRHATFLRMARRVIDVMGDAHFIIVGDGPLRPSLEAEAAGLGVTDRVHFVGSQTNVIPYLSLFTVAVNCSANEGLSNAIMEYMAYGIPCVVSDAGGNPELIKHDVNGYTFKLDDDEELSRMVLGLLDDDKKMRAFIKKSRERILSELTTEKMIEHYEQYFASMLKTKEEENNRRESLHTGTRRYNV